jgi:alpha-beta hydrolase superfamily lysophospholipase
MIESTFEGKGGIPIFTRAWKPDGPARAVVVIVHGFNSHSGQYLWVGEQLAAKGLAVYALDHRGRGKSGGERFFVETAADYVDDVATFVNIAKSEQPGLPVYLLGHSAGGVISCTYALDRQSEIAGLICESFAFQVYAPDLVLAIVKGLSHIAPHVHVLKLPKEEFSRDPQVVQSMFDDPLIADENQPSQTVAAMVRADERLAKEFDQIKLPVLILHGTNDKVTKPGGSQIFYDNAGSKDKTLKLYDGYVHDLLNDVGKEVPMADIQGWLDARIPAR